MIDLTKELKHAILAVTPQLKSLVGEVVRSELLNAPQDPDRYIDAVAAGELLGMSPAAVRRAADRGTLPSTKLGRRLRFRTGDLHSLLVERARVKK